MIIIFTIMLQKVDNFQSMNNLLTPQQTPSQSTEQEQPLQNESDIDLQNQMQEYTSIGQEYLSTDFSNSSKQESFEMNLHCADNDPILINKHNSPSADQIRYIINQLQSPKGDFSSFWNIWNQSDYKKVMEGFFFNIESENWKLLRYQTERPLENLLQLCQSKIVSTSHANQIYPGLVKLRNEIMTRLQATINETQMPQKDNQKKSDTLFEHFLKEIESKKKRQGAFYIKDKDTNGRKIPIGEFIARSEHASSHAWKDIFFKASVLHSRQSEDPKKQEQQEEKTERLNREIIKAEILKNANCVFPADNHICCAQFFFFNHKIYDQVITSCPIITERSFSRFIKEEQELTQTIKDIVGLMNSGGGVILFNVFKNYMEVWPKGEVILESQFQQAIKLIQEELRYIRPSVCFNEHIFISFVPVARNLFSDATVIENIKNYIEGLYVMRIVVKPTDEQPEYLHYYSKKDETKMFVVQKNTRKLIVPNQIHKLMKKRFKYYYIPEKDYADQQQKNMIKKTYSYFTNHGQCLTPQRGWLMKEKKVRPIDESTDKQLQKKYKYLTLIVTNINYLDVIEQRLRAKGIECQIVMKYHTYRFRAANNSAALFHNIKFNKLLQEVAYKKDFEFDQRYMLTILVTPYIKYADSKAPNESDCQTLQNWLIVEHPEQQLKVWQFSPNEKDYEYYFQTDSKLSTLFMYFLLTHYSMKSSFKNPKEFENMNEDEKKNRLKLWWSPKPITEESNKSEKKKKRSERK